MMNYTAYVPSREIRLEPAESGRYFFGANNEDWVQVINVHQLHDEPLRYCVSIGGILIGARSLYGDGFTSDPFLLSGHADAQKRYLKISQLPASVFVGVRYYSPQAVSSDQSIEIDRSTLTIALDAISSTVVARGMKIAPRDMSGIAIRMKSAAKS